MILMMVLQGLLWIWFLGCVITWRFRKILLVEGMGWKSAEFAVLCLYSAGLVAFYAFQPAGKWILLGILVLWLIVQFRCHWYYTIFGASEQKLTGYNDCFKGTVRIFPMSEKRLIPDLYHIVLHVLILAVCVCTACVDPGASEKVSGGAEGAEGTEAGGAAGADELVRVTFNVITGAPASYQVYVLEKDKYVHYNYTSYWLEQNHFDYFNEPVPKDKKYLVKEKPMNADVWAEMEEAFLDGSFSKLPEDMHMDGLMDGATYYIEVVTGSGSHLSGGYGAGSGNGKKHNSFTEFRMTISSACKKCEE